MLKLILVAVVLLALAVAGIAVKMFVFKDGQFRKSCSSADPDSGEKMSCSCGGDACENG